MNFHRRTGDILLDGFRFRGTPGLYQLLFYNDPSFAKDDTNPYKQILLLTKAHLNSAGRMKSSPRLKYVEIIRPMFRSNSSGRGLKLTYNTAPIEYMYWDDPNELVDRLKLLIASQQAGNTSNDNEIVAILNELEEAGIIKHV